MKEEELQKNYDEYHNYMKMIGNMLDDPQDSGPNGSNNM
jgi:hypothetical protein